MLEGANVKFVAQQQAVVPGSAAGVEFVVGFSSHSSAGYEESDNVLVRLAVSIRAHGRGGTLLVVPKDGLEWRQSIVHPISYSVSPPFSELDGLRDDPDALRSAVEALAGPTAVDGATVISDRFEMLAFGVKIIARDGAPHVARVLVTEPVEGASEEVVEPSHLGNTRHLSAAQFVSDQRDSIALVASQDGRFTVFTWSPSREIVHAHRLETLSCSSGVSGGSSDWLPNDCANNYDAAFIVASGLHSDWPCTEVHSDGDLEFVANRSRFRELFRELLRAIPDGLCES